MAVVQPEQFSGEQPWHQKDEFFSLEVGGIALRVIRHFEIPGNQIVAGGQQHCCRPSEPLLLGFFEVGGRIFVAIVVVGIAVEAVIRTLVGACEKVTVDDAVFFAESFSHDVSVGGAP